MMSWNVSVGMVCFTKESITAAYGKAPHPIHVNAPTIDRYASTWDLLDLYVPSFSRSLSIGIRWICSKYRFISKVTLTPLSGYLTSIVLARDTPEKETSLSITIFCVLNLLANASYISSTSRASPAIRRSSVILEIIRVVLPSVILLTES